MKIKDIQIARKDYLGQKRFLRNGRLHRNYNEPCLPIFNITCISGERYGKHITSDKWFIYKNVSFATESQNFKNLKKLKLID